MQLRTTFIRRIATRLASATILGIFLSSAARLAVAGCVGDCHSTGVVSVADVITMVDITLGTADPESCRNGDANGDGEIKINDIVAAVNNALSGCPSATPTPTVTSTESPSATPTLTPTTEEPSATPTSTVAPEPTSTETLTPTEEPSATPTLTPTEESTQTPTATATLTPTQNGVLSIADAVARDADGKAVHLGQTITTEGVVTVAAGLFANMKLKVFIQDGNAGIMVYHQSSAAIDDPFQPGQRLRASGVIRQQDPTSDSNPAIGTVAVDITQGSWTVVSDGNALPNPQVVTLATLNASGTSYTGTIVRINGVQKVLGSGNWPTAPLTKSTQVSISDDGGTTINTLRLQRFTTSQALLDELKAIGDGAFDLTGIVVQDDGTDDGKLLSGFEIWERGADDVMSQ